MNIPYYLKIGRASDLRDSKERKIYRGLEIFPGILSWSTLVGVVLLSWLKPVWIAIFIIVFVIYWFFKSIYLSFHLHACYRRMKKHQQIDWIKKLNELPGKDWKSIYHLVIFPIYKEPLRILREVLQSLLKTDWPKNKMIVVLTVEERGGEETKLTAQILKKKFGDKFFKFLLTYHPTDLPGEIAGKGSNETWGAKEAKTKIIDPLKIPYQNIIVSSFDADTCVFEKYFSCLTYHYLTTPNPLRSSFQPIPLFINNIWETPPISRMFAFSASFWQMMCQERPEKLLTFSSHSMSFKALVDCGFKQTNVVSDDSRIFWQCFLRYDGDYRVIPLYYPISMDANCGPTFLKTIKNVYKQQRRWAYGVGDIPYFIFGFLKSRKNLFWKKLSLGFALLEGHWSWATSSIMIFLLGWLPLVLGGGQFDQTLLAYNLPVSVRNILTISMIGLISCAYFNILLLPPNPPQHERRKKSLFFVLEWFLFPVIMIFFSALPALDAQTRWMVGKYMGFWPTPKIRR